MFIINPLSWPYRAHTPHKYLFYLRVWNMSDELKELKDKEYILIGGLNNG
jgi:hypothetical protein